MEKPFAKILVVEDEPTILQGIVDALQHQGFQVLATARGDEALSMALTAAPDLVVLDIMLPKLSGLDVCQNLRRSGLKAPIIFLTAKGRESDRVHGLELGADDYMTKPFSIKELIARINAHLRRRNLDALERESSPSARGTRSIKNLTVDFEARACWLAGEPVHLSEKEFSILRILLENLGKVVSRITLLKEVWGYTSMDLETRTVDVTIGKLRQKIEADANEPEIIKTKRGSGYIIEGPL